jgi:hypothetical protein
MPKAKYEGCPCIYTTPCHPDCTCVNHYMSRGCERCCTYGSFEQRTRMAEHLVNTEKDTKRLDWLETTTGGFANIDRITALRGFFNGYNRLRHAIDAATAKEKKE